MHTFSPLYALFCVNICEKPLTFTKTILFNCIFPVYFCIVGRKDLAYEFYTIKIRIREKFAALFTTAQQMWYTGGNYGSKCPAGENAA